MTRSLFFFIIAILVSAALFAGLVSSVQQRHSAAHSQAASPAFINVDLTVPPVTATPSPMSLAASSPSVPQTVAHATASARTYLPASALTERPVVLQDIDTELLPALWPVSAQTLVFQLLINEYGDVDQVIVEKSSLPQGLLAELRQRFLAARFAPGRLRGRAVATALRIAVQLQ